MVNRDFPQVVMHPKVVMQLAQFLVKHGADRDVHSAVPDLADNLSGNEALEAGVASWQQMKGW